MAGSDEVNRNECKVRARVTARDLHPLPACLVASTMLLALLLINCGGAEPLSTSVSHRSGPPHLPLLLRCLAMDGWSALDPVAALDPAAWVGEVPGWLQLQLAHERKDMEAWPSQAAGHQPRLSKVRPPLAVQVCIHYVRRNVCVGAIVIISKHACAWTTAIDLC